MMVGVPATPTIIFLSLAKKMRVKGPSSAQKVGQKVKGFQISDDFGKLSTVPSCFPSRLLLHERRKPGGGGSLFLGLSCAVCVYSLTSAMSDSLRPYGLWPARLLCPWDSPGKNTRVGYHALLQWIFLTQGSNSHLLCLLYCRQILYH